MMAAFLQRVAAAVTSQVDRWSYYIDLLRNGCSGDGTDIEGPRHGLPRNGRASGADLIRLSARADRDWRADTTSLYR
jgi:hypothetical protein